MVGAVLALAEPYSKERQLARGERRYRRKVASPKQWQAIIAAKGHVCRLANPPLTHERWGAVQYHHIVPRDLGGDDCADNIVPLCAIDHNLVTQRHEAALYRLAESLTDSERAYVVGKLGEDGLSRLFGATR
jgi:5-methylcytosine-specific restriction endonuclease McrA